MAEQNSDTRSIILKSLGEMIASQEIHEGVLIGLTSEAIMERWSRLFKSHVNDPIFRWPDAPAFSAFGEFEPALPEER